MTNTTQTTKDTTLWSGTLWHADCDPFVQIVAKTHDELLQLLNDHAEEEADFVNDGDPDAEIDICQAETQMTAGELGLSDREMAELDEDGYLYLER